MRQILVARNIFEKIMEAALKNLIVTRFERLPKGKILEVLNFVEFMLFKASNGKSKPVEATDQEILHALEARGALDFYYDDSQDVYTLEDGEPFERREKRWRKLAI